VCELKGACVVMTGDAYKRVQDSCLKASLAESNVCVRMRAYMLLTAHRQACATV